MAKKMGKRIYRQATVEEQERHKRIREQIQEELPDIKQRAQQKLAEAMQHGIAIQHTMAVLKAERVKKGLSLCRYESAYGHRALHAVAIREQCGKPIPLSIPSPGTLTAVGKKVFVVLADTDEVEAGSRAAIRTKSQTCGMRCTVSRCRSA